MGQHLQVEERPARQGLRIAQRRMRGSELQHNVASVLHTCTLLTPAAQSGDTLAWLSSSMPKRQIGSTGEQRNMVQRDERKVLRANHCYATFLSRDPDRTGQVSA